MDRILSVKDLSVTYKNKYKSVYAVRNVDLEINRGDSVGIVGESGSGKSTLAMALLRLLPETTAEITGSAEFMDKDLLTIPQTEMNELRWTKLSVVFQKAMNSFSPVHKIGAQIVDIYRVHYPKATKNEIYQRAIECLELVNLGKRVLDLYPHQLSGGMMQRVSIAAALLHKPDLLIMDEATTALDVVTQGQILEEVKSMEKNLNTTRIMITHDMSVVAASCNRVAIMYAGEILEDGPVEQIFRRPVHPYTQGLLGSFPSLKGENKKLVSIPGFLPDLSRRYEGCIFAPRCSRATEECFRSAPKPQLVQDNHKVSCHYAAEVRNE